MIEDLTTNNLVSCVNAVIPAAEQTIESAVGKKEEKIKPQMEVKKTETKRVAPEVKGTVEIDPRVSLFSEQSLRNHGVLKPKDQNLSDTEKTVEEVEEPDR